MRGKLRIIGGKWRGRKLDFADIPEIRPTPDRIRETVFNWLAPDIRGAACLDLFAGSGALGFEALSRGAAKVVMVDRSRSVIFKLKEIAEMFEAEPTIDFYCAAMPDNLEKLAGNKFDIIFLDPPFRQGLIAATCAKLEQINCLADNAWIYIEAESELVVAEIIPANWQMLRNKKAGQVGYYLIKRASHEARVNNK
jgi:16S rRNA (guanine966-N2)-methyltransferase